MSDQFTNLKSVAEKCKWLTQMKGEKSQMLQIYKMIMAVTNFLSGSKVTTALNVYNLLWRIMLRVSSRSRWIKNSLSSYCKHAQTSHYMLSTVAT